MQWRIIRMEIRYVRPPLLNSGCVKWGKWKMFIDGPPWSKQSVVEGGALHSFAVSFSNAANVRLPLPCYVASDKWPLVLLFWLVPNSSVHAILGHIFREEMCALELSKCSLFDRSYMVIDAITCLASSSQPQCHTGTVLLFSTGEKTVDKAHLSRSL